MNKYRRPMLVVAAAVAISSLMSACIVVPARGYYRRYYSEATPAQTAPVPAAPAPSQG